MPLDNEQLEIMFRARMLGTERGQVLEPWAYPEAHRLAEAGWLERRFVGPGDEMSWWLSPKGDLALDVAALTSSVEGRHN